MVTCVWCGKRLRFITGIAGYGWVHDETGQTYTTRVDADGIERDDHCALPKADGNRV